MRRDFAISKGLLGRVPDAVHGNEVARIVISPEYLRALLPCGDRPAIVLERLLDEALLASKELPARVLRVTGVVDPGTAEEACARYQGFGWNVSWARAADTVYDFTFVVRPVRSPPPWDPTQYSDFPD